tara:strand:- start:23 stop:532 length:510 start_codon:yes stop_codon:yes gene_type:complete
MNFNFSLGSINNYNKLSEVTIDNNTTNNNNNNNIKMFEFNKNIENISCNPYIYIKTFPKNISFNSFTLNICKLLKHRIEKKEVKYLYNTYGVCFIKKIYRLKDIIEKYYKPEKDNIYTNFISILILNKRLEFLLEYIIENDFSQEYENYINIMINNLKKTTKFIVESLQ